MIPNFLEGKMRNKVLSVVQKPLLAGQLKDNHQIKLKTAQIKNFPIEKSQFKLSH